MNRLVALPLIPLLLIGAVLPRAHGYLGGDGSENAAARSHVHLSGEHGHQHGDLVHSHHHEECTAEESDGDASAALTQFARPEHHHDAIYLADFHFVGRFSYKLRTVVSEPLMLVGVGRVSPLLDRCKLIRPQAERAASRFGTLPVYLSLAVLRL